RFADTKARVISMFSHDALTDPATLFVGHTGIAVPYEGKILFLEKIAFDMPYQAIVVKDMQQLNDYLMKKYDDGPGLEDGRPGQPRPPYALGVPGSRSPMRARSFSWRKSPSTCPIRPSWSRICSSSTTT